MPHMLGVLCASLLMAAAAGHAHAREIRPNRKWDVLSPTGSISLTDRLREAAASMGGRQLTVGLVLLDGVMLDKMADATDTEPPVAVLRTHLRLAIDPQDFLWFLDDVLKQLPEGDTEFVLTPGRCRKLGVCVHPDDVFKGTPRPYTRKPFVLNVPDVPDEMTPARNGGVLGPEWVARYTNPTDEAEQMEALERENASFARRISRLLGQLRAQGSDVNVGSTVRDRRRGYLMWGAYWLSQSKSRHVVSSRVRTLKRLNRLWRLRVPIRWQHPKGWRNTVALAERMREAYDVVYATRRGAQRSHHYDGLAIDMSARALPAKLRLTAPTGEVREFDLSDPQETRDLSLTPEVIAWVEEQFEVRKLKMDYPHWDDRQKSKR